MNAEQFVYWLNGYLELSGAQELSAAQVKSVREHLALVLHKVTPPGPAASPPAPAWQPGPGWKQGHRGEWAFGGVQCGVCQRWCSNEGGVCNKCMLSTTTSGPGNRIDPFSTPEPAGLCDGCGKECPHSELNTVISSNLAGVVVCDECRQPKRPHSLNILEAPIVDVPCVLTC